MYDIIYEQPLCNYAGMNSAIFRAIQAIVQWSTIGGIQILVIEEKQVELLQVYQVLQIQVSKLQLQVLQV